jgi:hypothetical protein
VIALIAAALLALTMAGPVAADPIGKSQFPNLYEIDCKAAGGGVTFQNAHGVPGWDTSWAPGDTPWLLLGYTITGDGWSDVRPLPPGLDRRGKLYGPCTINTIPEGSWEITEAYFLQR